MEEYAIEDYSKKLKFKDCVEYYRVILYITGYKKIKGKASIPEDIVRRLAERGIKVKWGVKWVE